VSNSVADDKSSNAIMLTYAHVLTAADDVC